MSWSAHHQKSEEYASAAQLAARLGRIEESSRYYELAAEEEEQALEALELSKARTVGITAVSASSLWLKAHEFARAQRVAHHWLASGILPKFAVEQLQNLLQIIWTEETLRKADVGFTRGEVLFSIKGGEVIPGAAPLDLILRKVSEVSKMFYRTVEMLLDLPLRKHGDPSWDIQQQCRPWLFQVPAGSYQFAVRVQQPKQMQMFPDAAPRVEKITSTFLQIVRASAEGPDGDLVNIVPRAEYRTTFLKMARNLAPTNKSSFNRVEIRPADDTDFRPVILRVGEREAINESLRIETTTLARHEETQEEPLQLIGVLRGLQLNQDWIDLKVSEDEPDIRIYEAGDAIDDVIGPMVNHRVIADVVRKKTGKYVLRDIQSEE